ncbi:MAG: hypothetical protein WDM70_03765 [Nitrosomonadales bacterium]
MAVHSAQGPHGHFDRSWYGRVLVERVEGFCSPGDWMRAYQEINDFEAQLVRHNYVVVKFWLTISKDEQLRRFEERKQTGFKRFKITDEDWRNREKWMPTSKPSATWWIAPAPKLHRGRW